MHAEGLISQPVLKRLLQRPYVPVQGGAGLVLGGYPRTPGCNPLTLAENGLPTEKTLYRLYHILGKKSAEALGVEEYFKTSDVYDKVAFLDFAPLAVEGPLGKGSDAPHIMAARDERYCAATRQLLVCTVDLMGERNGGKPVAAVCMLKEWRTIVATPIAGLPIVGFSRHLMQFGNMLRQKGTLAARAEERGGWDAALRELFIRVWGLEDTVPDALDEFTPWEDLVANECAMDPEEQAQYQFGGAGGADPSKAGVRFLRREGLALVPGFLCWGLRVL